MKNQITVELRAAVGLILTLFEIKKQVDTE